MHSKIEEPCPQCGIGWVEITPKTAPGSTVYDLGCQTCKMYKMYDPEEESVEVNSKLYDVEREQRRRRKTKQFLTIYTTSVFAAGGTFLAVTGSIILGILLVSVGLVVGVGGLVDYE